MNESPDTQDKKVNLGRQHDACPGGGCVALPKFRSSSDSYSARCRDLYCKLFWALGPLGLIRHNPPHRAHRLCRRQHMDLDYGLMQSSSAGRGWRWVQGRPLPAQGFATEEGGGSVGV